jgi:hypothetical protein
MLTESLLLSGFGGTAGLLLGYLGRNIVPRLLTGSSQVHQGQVQFDWLVLVFTLVISFATGILFGLAPAWQATRIAAHAGLRESGGSTASRQRLWFDETLVIGQVAISAALLMGAGLFAHTLFNLDRIPLGFESNHVLLFRINLPRARYSDAQMTAFFQKMEEGFARSAERAGCRQLRLCMTFSDSQMIELRFRAHLFTMTLYGGTFY